MAGFPIELARSILNLEMQKDKILKNDYRTKRLCFCRKHILLNYVSVCQLFFIRFSSKLVKFEEDRSVDKTSIVDLRSWYENEIYNKQFSDPNISSKMVLVFKLLQDTIDAGFFDEFEVMFKSTIENIDQPDYKENVSTLFMHLNDWMENYLLNILTLKIDCMKISDDILTKYNLVENFRCDGSGMSPDCNRCADDCPALVVGHDQYYREEEIHLYMSEEFDHSDFLMNYFEVMSKNHKDPKNIRVIFDFMLYDAPFHLSSLQQQWMDVAKTKFKCIEVINYKAPRN